MMVKITEKKIIKKPAVRRGRPPKAKVGDKEAKKEEIKTTFVVETKRPFITAIGRRKTAVARVKFLETGTGKIKINGQELEKYFNFFILQEIVKAPLELTQENKNHDIEVIAKGGGNLGQAEAIRLGIARALIKWNLDLKPVLRKAGYMTRDPRAKERKKFGLKKARRAPQWSKR